jgi:hypothetical protein
VKGRQRSVVVQDQDPHGRALQTIEETAQVGVRSQYAHFPMIAQVDDRWVINQPRSEGLGSCRTDFLSEA